MSTIRARRNASGLVGAPLAICKRGESFAGSRAPRMPCNAPRAPLGLRLSCRGGRVGVVG
eukprot:5892961-Prymnesium_polylepis.1